MEEAKLQASLEHKNILKVFGLTQPLNIMNPEDGKIYVNPGIVFEYAEFGDLERYIQMASVIEGSHGLISESSARFIFHSIIDALKYLKKKGRSHNDIKPGNILINQSGTVKLADFGHCYFAMGVDGKGLIGMCGTQGYTGPEVSSENFYSGPENDIHAFGKTIDEIMLKLCKPEAISPSYKRLIKKMTSSNPKRRPLLENLSRYSWYEGPVSKPEQFESELFNLYRLWLFSTNQLNNASHIP